MSLKNRRRLASRERYSMNLPIEWTLGQWPCAISSWGPAGGSQGCKAPANIYSSATRYQALCQVFCTFHLI